MVRHEEIERRIREGDRRRGVERRIKNLRINDWMERFHAARRAL